MSDALLQAIARADLALALNAKRGTVQKGVGQVAMIAIRPSDLRLFRDAAEQLLANEFKPTAEGEIGTT